MIYEPIRLDGASDRPMYRQLYESIRDSIGGGRLEAGEKMPSIRRLSEELGVSRTTVEQAYQQLCVEGYLASRPQSGYYVEAVPSEARVTAPVCEALPEKSDEAAVRWDFGSRYVDMRSTDIELWRKYVRSVLSREEIVSSYGHYQGEPELRRQLAHYSMLLRGVNAAPERIVVGAGVQPLLSLLCGLLGERAGRVGIEYPCFPQAERVFRDFRLHIVPLGHDRYGVTPRELYASKIDMLYLNPSDIEGTGLPMPVSRRGDIIEWAERTDGLVIEDDYNGALRFKSRPVPSMQGMDGGGRVVYMGSFSKLLMPSVRISYMVLPGGLASLYRERGSHYNQTSSKVEQLALADYMRDGHIEKRLRRLRKIYAEKSGALMALLEEYFGRDAKVGLAETALCVDIAFPCAVSGEELARRALPEGLRVIPAEAPAGMARVRLSFAGIAEEEMRGGVALLHRLAQA